MARRISIVRRYDYVPLDISVAFYEVATKTYGQDCFSGARNEKWWFLRDPVVINNNIKSGPSAYSRGVGGYVVIRDLPGTFAVAPRNDNLVVAEDIPADQAKAVEQFLDKIQNHLTRASIYRGRAITTEGEFLDLSGINAEDAVYNERVARELKAHVWTIMEQPDMCKSMGIELPRKILLEGPFGSGKTLAAMITAQKAVRCNWTFVYVPPTSAQKERAPLNEVMNFARYYDKPGAVIFIEDIDREQREHDQYYLGSILSAVDGITSKTSRVLFLMSTNFRDKITAAMQRPGRIDKAIDFGVFMAEDRKKLLVATMPANILTENIDWAAVIEACKDFHAAFVKETAKSAMLFALSENKERPLVTTEMLIEAASGLRGQFRKVSEALGFGK